MTSILLFVHEAWYPLTYKEDNSYNLKIDKCYNESNNSNFPYRESEQDLNNDPEQDPDDEDFVQKTVDNNNLLSIKPKHKFSLQH
jgi:hypothetical protein